MAIDLLGRIRSHYARFGEREGPHLRSSDAAGSEIVNSGIGGQPGGAALLSEGKLSARCAVVYTGVSGTRVQGEK